MLPASNRGMGQALGFPDVCNTPTPAGPVPIPYPNMALNAQAQGFSVGVKICMMNALNMGSQIPTTMGDEAGSAHPTIKGPQRYSMGNPIVKIDGMPAINLACPTNHNNSNCPLGAVIVPSVANVFFCDRELSDNESWLQDRLATERAESVAHSAPMGSDALYLCLSRFGSRLLPQCLAAMSAHGFGLARPPGSLIFDLRGCPGGTLESAAELASLLLPEGSPIATLRVAGREQSFVAAGSSLSRCRVALLIDEGTASAAEVFAAALAAHGAEVFGRASYGKHRSDAVTLSQEGFVLIEGTIAWTGGATRVLPTKPIADDMELEEALLSFLELQPACEPFSD